MAGYERAADDLAVLDDHGTRGPADLQALREAGIGGGARQDGADGPRGEPDDGQRGVLYLDLVRLGGAYGRDLGGRSEAPAEQVDVVHALVHQRAAVHGVGAAPGRAVVVGLAAVPLRAGLAEHEPAQGTVIEQAPQLDQARIEAVLGDHGQCHPGGPGRLDEPVRGGQADVDRLLHDQVLARPCGADADLRVQAARHAHAHHLDIRAGEQGAEVGLGRAAAGRGEGRGGAGGHVGDRHQPGVRQPGVRQPGVRQPGVRQPGVRQPGVRQPGVRQPGLRQQGDGIGVDRRDHSGADDPETAGHGHQGCTSIHSASTLRCCGSATSGSAISGCQRFSHSTEIQPR